MQPPATIGFISSHLADERRSIGDSAAPPGRTAAFQLGGSAAQLSGSAHPECVPRTAYRVPRAACRVPRATYRVPRPRAGRLSPQRGRVRELRHYQGTLLAPPRRQQGASKASARRYQGSAFNTLRHVEHATPSSRLRRPTPKQRKMSQRSVFTAPCRAERRESRQTACGSRRDKQGVGGEEGGARRPTRPARLGAVARSRGIRVCLSPTPLGAWPQSA